MKTRIPFERRLQIEQAVRDSWPYHGHCPDCGYLNSHSITCKLSSREYQLLKIEELQDQCDHLRQRAQHFGREVVAWQGRHAIVCRENNALRRKLFRREKSNDKSEGSSVAVEKDREISCRSETAGVVSATEAVSSAD